MIGVYYGHHEPVSIEEIESAEPVDLETHVQFAAEPDLIIDSDEPGSDIPQAMSEDTERFYKRLVLY